MAAYDNFDEVYFTVQALRFYHPEAMKRFEIIVVDNNPESRDGKAVKSLIEGRVKDRGRYIPFPEPKGSCPPRGHLFEAARGKFVICIDSHVFLDIGVLGKFCEWFDQNPNSDDLLHGPLLSNYGPHRIEGSHMVPRWRSAMFGTWGVDERSRDPEGEAFEIPQHGLGLFAARRESWLGFHPELVGFSGGEGYIHEKYRQAGRRVLCLPFARWYHKFARPHGIPHRPTAEAKIKNHVRGWVELGVDLADGSTEEPVRSMCEHYVGGRGMKNDKPAMSFERFKSLCREVGHEYSLPAPTPPLSACVIGPLSFGSFQMRGKPIATELGLKVYNSRSKVRVDREYDVALVVKAGVPPVVRKAAKRVIWEPLDLWWGDRKEAALDPEDWLLRKWELWQFDEIILSTIGMKEAAEAALSSKGVIIHLVPHHADERVGLDWYDPAGPIVYAGMRDFVRPAIPAIEEAAAAIGRKVVFDFAHHAWQSLEGASLVLAPRLGLRTKMNVIGKPTVKIANAAQAGIPVLATPDSSITDLFPDVKTAEVSIWSDAKLLGRRLEGALVSPASIVKFPRDRWLERMKEIIG